MEVLLLTVILLALAIGGIAIKMFFRPEGKFTKTCASKFDPDTGKPGRCSCASGIPDDCESEKQLNTRA